MPPASPGLQEQVVRALAFAQDRLGPCSWQLLTDPARQAMVLSRIRAGAELEDAVLAEVHERAGADLELANEFVAYFVGDLLRLGRPLIGDGLHRFLDTGDLAQSVLGDIWERMTSLRFESRAAFISLLAQRLSWKASSHARALVRDKRGEDRRVSEPPEELDLVDRGPSPPSVAGGHEDRDRMILALMRLSDRDRRILNLHLQGESIEVVMERESLTRDAAHKAVQRAVRRARQIVARDRTLSVSREGDRGDRG